MFDESSNFASEPAVIEQISVIVPVTERPSDLNELYNEFSAPFRATGRPYEFIFALEPWYEDLAQALGELVEHGEPVRILRVAQVAGESALLRLGASHARGDVIVTLPAYYRVEAESLPSLLASVEADADMAVARRWPRIDSWINRLQNRLFHLLLRRLGRGKLRDVACGVKAMRREVLETVPLYGDNFRFLPLLALNEGYRVVEVDAPQHKKDQSVRVYNPGTYVRRALDVLAIFFLLRFTEKPLRFFGLLGFGSLLFGSCILGILAIQRIGGTGIAGRPLLLLGVLMVVVGVQLAALGLVGEVIVHLNASRRNPYRLGGRFS